MNLHAGGFGLSGLMAIPHIREYLRKEKTTGIILNGIAGLYTVSIREFDKRKAAEVVMDFLETFENSLKVMERTYAGNCKKSTTYRKEIAYCAHWTTAGHLVNWESFRWFESFSNTVYSGIYIELLDLVEKRPLLFSGTAKAMAQASVAFPGLFPPLGGRYVSTTYYTQIPVSFVEDGDTVILNLLKPDASPQNANQILTRVLQLRQTALAKELLSKKKIKTLHPEGQINWDKLKDENFLSEIFCY
ncbi:hypothetical protein AT15_02190 [Kosmotoga arenicorallina S304]|uniref:PNPLA domain-containing protein n=1 Tax=Kosmotoga arenicorallina S304 TaxID=1453497 RepID=A0A176JZ87_9BACT|nr:hypothetical protein [Kosmotoga arenicorallina]OAA29350.1 hypothetical protein AT15_02190 [Kosmotoga arenicorallina S304]